jgi:Rrf2 family protein
MRAAVYLAARPAGGFTSVREVSQALRIPYPFLAKIAQTLTRAGLLRTLRGPTGGVTLARPAGDIALKDIVLAIDGPNVFRECVLGLPGCGDQRPCPLHAQWAGARARIEAMLGEASLADIAQATAINDFRLAAA